MREQIDLHHEAAKTSGARITFSSGFDSIPFDLGVLMLQHEAVARHGSPAPRVKGRVRAMQGTFSGGTAASLTATMKAAAKNPGIIKVLNDPFGLAPGFDGPDQPSGMIPHYEDELGKWAAPFIMATINTKNVHRTNFLRGHPYGEDFRYDEMMLTSPGEAGKAAANAVTEMLKNPFGAKPPKPGEGPSKDERENGYYDVLFVGEWPDGKRLHYGVKGKYDPGYGSTSRMLAEAAPKSTDRALVIESGTGYLAELLRPLVASVDTLDASELARGKSKLKDFDLVLVDGALGDVPKSLVKTLAENGRVVSGIIDGDIPRLAVGRRTGDRIAFDMVDDTALPALPMFAQAKEWSF